MTVLHNVKMKHKERQFKTSNNVLNSFVSEIKNKMECPKCNHASGSLLSLGALRFSFELVFFTLR